MSVSDGLTQHKERFLAHPLPHGADGCLGDSESHRLLFDRDSRLLPSQELRPLFLIDLATEFRVLGSRRHIIYERTSPYYFSCLAVAEGGS